MSRGSATAVVACALALLAAPASVRAAVPPNANDPCARDGRDTCGTTGVGFYRPTRYGTRWFGDFRDAIPGRPHAFCIDFRFWYAARSYRYREAQPAVLRNRDGDAVPAVNQQKIAYAIWRYGHSTRPRQQAAVMLYVHSLMGDARRGEIDPGAVRPRIDRLYRRIARAAAYEHGPYRIVTSLPRGLVVGRPATASVRVVSAGGRALPAVTLSVSGQGVETVSEVQADGTGRADVPLTPTAVDLQLRLTATPVAPSRPTVFVPTRPAAAPNGQRLAVAPAARTSAVVAGHALPVLAAATSRQIVRPGSPVSSRISVTGLTHRPASIETEVFGPFPSHGRIRCTGTPFRRARIATAGASEIRSPPVELARPGFYAYQVRLLASGPVAAVSTSCGLASTTTLVAPRIVTGRGDRAAEARARGLGGRTPVRLRSRSLRIDAPIVPVAIDLTRGVLGVPASVGRTGWWRDGMAPGSRTGAILIAGHVDSARAGAGALFGLPNARSGQRIQVETAAGRVYTYRVVSVHSYPKRSLPNSVYEREGEPRLVLVTCGGRFDAASGHYLDNIVVTAVPV